MKPKSKKPRSWKAVKPEHSREFYEATLELLQALGEEETIPAHSKLLREIDDISDYCGDAIHRRGIFSRTEIKKK